MQEKQDSEKKQQPKIISIQDNNKDNDIDKTRTSAKTST
jgi:hypothetical protein